MVKWSAVLVILLAAALPLLAVGETWKSDEHKCSFTMLEGAWKNTTNMPLGILKDGVVEFYNINDFTSFSFAPFIHRTDEKWKSETAQKTIETTQSMIGAVSEKVWLIREEPEYPVNGVSGYKREIGFQTGGIDYTAIIVVLVKDSVHYRLLFTSLEKNYSTSFDSFKRIVGSFRIRS